MKNQALISILLSLYCIIITESAHLDGRVEPLTYEEIQEINIEVNKECYEDPSPPGKNYSSFSEFKHEMNCWLDCKLKRLGITTEDNKLNKEALKFLVNFNLSGGLNCSDTQFYEKCSSITDPDSCEYSDKLYQCFKSACGNPKIERQT